MPAARLDLPGRTSKLSQGATLTIPLLSVLLLFESLSPSLIEQESLPGDAGAIWSPGRTYRAAVEFESGNSEFVPLSRFKLVGPDHRTVYERRGDGHTVLDVSDHGQVVGIDFDGPVSGHARLHFYDRAGTVKGSADVGFLDHRAFSDDGSAYAVLDGRSGLRVFSVDGTERYNLGPGTCFALSADGRTAALARDGEIALTRDGSETARVPLASPFTRQLAVSPDGSVLAWVDRFLLHVWRTADPEKRVEVLPPEPGLRFVSVSVSTDARLIAAGLDYDAGRGTEDRHRRGLVLLTDPSGTALWQEPLAYGRWNISVPSVRFRTDGGFEVRTADLVHEYRY